MKEVRNYWYSDSNHEVKEERSVHNKIPIIQIPPKIDDEKANDLANLKTFNYLKSSEIVGPTEDFIQENIQSKSKLSTQKNMLPLNSNFITSEKKGNKDIIYNKKDLIFSKMNVDPDIQIEEDNNINEIGNQAQIQIENFNLKNKVVNQISQHRNYNCKGKIDKINDTYQKNIQKQEYIRAEMETKLIKECTFQPNVDKLIRNQRTINQFYKDQQSFIEKRNFNLQKLQEDQSAKEEMTIYDKPQICRSSLELAYNKTKLNKNENENEKNICTRLYDLKTESYKNFIKVNKFSDKEINKSNSQKKEKLTSDPRVESSLNGVKSINILLYNDALRRQQRIKEAEYNIQTNRVKVKKFDHQESQFLINKLEREMIAAFLKSEIKENFVEFQQFQLILYSMGFILETPSDISNQEKQICELWRFIGGESNNKITKSMLLKVLSSIMNIIPSKIAENEFGSKKDIKFNSLNINRDEINESTILTSKDTLDIHQKFHRLYLNKLTSNRLSSESEKANYSFRPTINDNSVLLANEVRKKIINETMDEIKFVNNMNINDDTIIDKKAIIADHLVYSNKKKIDLMLKKKQENEAKAFQQCTFKPIISKYNPYPFNLKMHNKKEKKIKPSNSNQLIHHINSLSQISNSIKGKEGNSPNNHEEKILKKEVISYVKAPQNKNLIINTNPQKIKIENKVKPSKILKNRRNVSKNTPKLNTAKNNNKAEFTRSEKIQEKQVIKEIKKEKASISNENKKETKDISIRDDKFNKNIDNNNHKLPEINKQEIVLKKANSSLTRKLKIDTSESLIYSSDSQNTGKYKSLIPLDMVDSPNCKIFTNIKQRIAENINSESKNNNEYNIIKIKNEINLPTKEGSGFISEENNAIQKDYESNNSIQDNNIKNSQIQITNDKNSKLESSDLKLEVIDSEINPKNEVMLDKFNEDKLSKFIPENKESLNFSGKSSDLISSTVITKENNKCQNNYITNNDNLKSEIIEISKLDQDTSKEQNSFEENKASKDVLLYIDINIGENKNKRICFYPNDSAKSISEKFVIENNLDLSIISKLTEIIEEKLSKILTKEEKIFTDEENKKDYIRQKAD